MKKKDFVFGVVCAVIVVIGMAFSILDNTSVDYASKHAQEVIWESNVAHEDINWEVAK